ncbi:MAG: RNA-binding protein [Rhizomicrobium sp.]
MTQAASLATEDDDALRERRCIVTGEALPESRLIRYVADPEGRIVPDVAAVLPGRGIWVSASRDILGRAIAKNLFARAAKAQVVTPVDLADRTEAQLVARMCGDLGMARRSGAIVLGFDNVARALDGQPPPAVLVEAADGAADGRRKLAGTAAARGLKPVLVDVLTNAELSLALGRENVIHAALKPGRLAERLAFQAGRLEGFRPTKRPLTSAGSIPAPDKGLE